MPSAVFVVREILLGNSCWTQSNAKRVKRWDSSGEMLVGNESGREFGAGVADELA